MDRDTRELICIPDPQVPIRALEGLAVEYEGQLSRADLWAIAGLTANHEAQQGTAQAFSFDEFGRQDCGPFPTGGTQPKRDLPSPNLDTHGVLEYFKRVFGHTENETVAIMGAHTLGFAARNQSGFDGTGGWNSHPLVLDNKWVPKPPSSIKQCECLSWWLSNSYHCWRMK